MSHIRIDVENVSFEYETGKRILKDVSFHAGEGDSIGLIGANGVGKSTLLKMLVGLNLQFTGSIRVENIPVEKNTLSEIRSRIGYVFQDSDSQLFMNTVYEDVAFAPRNYGMSEPEVKRRVEEALHLTGIEYLENRQIYKNAAPVIRRQNILALGVAGEKAHTADEFVGVGVIRHTKDADTVHRERPVMVDGLRQCGELSHIPAGSSGAEIVHGVIGHAHSDILLTSYSCRPSWARRSAPALEAPDRKSVV